MDIETSEAIGQVGARIDVLERSLRVEFKEGFADNRRHAEGLFERNISHADGQFETLRDDIQVLRDDVQNLREDVQNLREDVQNLREDVQSLRDDVRILANGFATVSSEGADHRRHTQVLVEGIRDDIRMLAEGFAHISTKLDSIQR
jgi:chromosome segregation ATPase